MPPNGVSCEDCVWRHTHPKEHAAESRAPTPVHAEMILASVTPERAAEIAARQHEITGRARMELFVLTGQDYPDNSPVLRDERLRQLCCAARHGGIHHEELPEHMRNRQAPRSAETALGPLPGRQSADAAAETAA